MKTIFIAFFCLILSNTALGQEYTLAWPLETDSVLVAWLVHNHIDPEAVFTLHSPRPESAKPATAINTADSPFRRSFRFTAFDEATRIHHLESPCISRLKPMVRLLEMTPWRKSEYPDALQFERKLSNRLPTNPDHLAFADAFAFIDSYCRQSPAINAQDAEGPVSDTLTFIALVDDGWKVVVSSPQGFRQLDTLLEPHTYDYHSATDHLLYIGSDKSLRSRRANGETILLTPGPHSYTQPAFFPDGKRAAMVKLINGSSKNTEIIELDLQSGGMQILAAYHSTILEPTLVSNNLIYYTNVSCIEGCGSILQELWQKNLYSGKARQLTLLNALSHQPAPDPSGQWLYFSSNAKGTYHIWRMSPETQQYEQISDGPETDAFPTVTENGTLYFVRTKKQQSALMKLSSTGAVMTIPLPAEMRKLRELRTPK